jgi:hypothetical protein
MPFGRKQSRSGVEYDFDEIYVEAIRPAVMRAGAVTIRADEEAFGGVVHKPIYERLILSDIVTIDITTANPNVMYELGVRHAARSKITILISASGEIMPFDFAYLQTIVYDCVNGHISPASIANFKEALSSNIERELREESRVDSPIFALLDGYSGAEYSPEQRANIFLSYAREDEAAAVGLYEELKKKSFLPWIDKKNIKPGEVWERAIQMAVRKADFIFICLFSKSVVKRGYLRREIHEALDRSREMLDSDIFLFPIRLDDCDVPEELSRFQWVDLFKEDAFPHLVVRRRQLVPAPGLGEPDGHRRGLLAGGYLPSASDH